MNNIAIIYHDADFDGKLSREVCLHWLRKLHPKANLHPFGWDYGRPVPEGLLDFADKSTGEKPWVDFDQIYIVDLSVDELMARPELRDKIVWIDHHKSAIEKWDVGRIDPEGNPMRHHGYRIDGVAACRLCWQWFHFPSLRTVVGGLPGKQEFIDRKVSESTLIRLAGEYDIWDNRDPDAKALQFGLRTLSDAQLHELFETEAKYAGDSPALGSLVLVGHAIKEYCDKQNDEYAAAFSHTIRFAGLTMLALNIGQRGNSDLLRGGIKPEHEAGFAWRWDGKQVYVSLYHLPGHEQHDLSVIAGKWGGGGHKGACGFRITLVELNDILKSRYDYHLSD